MKRVLIGISVIAVVIAAVLVFIPRGQQPDRSYDVSLTRPAYKNRHPRVLIDAAHYNVHTMQSTYAPLANLLRHDGFYVAEGTERLTAGYLRRADVLIIANAAGGSNPKLLGLNLVPLRRGERGANAFTPGEIRSITEWVRAGGSLLLVADHYPFGSAAASLAAAFGVKMHGGFAEVPEQKHPGTIEYSRANGLLAEHPITAGVNRVLSFTGQSLSTSSPAATAILRLPPSAREHVPPPPNFRETAAGNAQAVALEYGKGRVVIFGEAAMLTAQIDNEGRKFGMNTPGCDNRQLVLNVLHWLRP